ncbi:hypothetical protein H6F43_02715 [Leptolyngbya sp. FACHB-36]|uniref:hypothetical protein n=1 Tax=Leptolyngbya sp. FACHB-36 TaxID=2692808 RepID=UPI0016811F38|nr:hypothetical protein [Leptolyngbya sp. FACHB-36]MBD2019097.1 hypothetical protein [Leptolyngbya sp. FACHB-36]
MVRQSTRLTGPGVDQRRGTRRQRGKPLAVARRQVLTYRWHGGAAGAAVMGDDGIDHFA